ncbi:HNH endonuclease [Planctomycetes bacterium Poly30]
MSKAVFIASSHSDWKDEHGERYHFPKSNYLSVVERTMNDWVVFYEGRRGGNRGYYATQRVVGIESDPSDAGHAYAILDRGTLLDFETNVPRTRADGTRYESTLPAMGGNNTSAVRLISEDDFADIIRTGLQPTITPDALPRDGAYPELESRSWPSHDGNDARGVDALPFDERTRILTSRAFRDQSFARTVKAAYRSRCAISGLELRNGGGRPEVEAAHIIPVASNGPDTVRNGLALSGTIHWMFDRGLISVAPDYTILLAPDSVAAEAVERLINPARKLLLPEDSSLHPHQSYLAWHRAQCFKG